MRGLRILIGLFVFTAAALAIAGWCLPRHWQVQASTSVAAPAEQTLAWLADLRHWSQWRGWPQSMQYHFGTSASGQGATLLWSDGATSGSVQITAYQPAEQMSYERRTDNSDTRRQCTFSVLEAATLPATQLSWQCSGELGANPYYRLLSYAIRPRIRRGMEQALQRVRAHFAAHPVEMKHEQG